jgi:hypothetical protein
LRIDEGNIEGHHLGNAQPGSVGYHESSPVAEARDVLEEALEFLLAENDGDRIGTLARSKAPASKGASRVTP